ncbi:Uncharacterized protein DAT39_006652 [Clarias magur]|uniref:Uncharacterized protein n=1 Tax=Clarias magur TaxID=1594786 RepID=A0A8J4UPJ9_CLAMG|nr:Uncharacterized protein DAT39_006652 [Clarias magur]
MREEVEVIQGSLFLHGENAQNESYGEDDPLILAHEPPPSSCPLPVACPDTGAPATIQLSALESSRPLGVRHPVVISTVVTHSPPVVPVGSALSNRDSGTVMYFKIGYFLKDGRQPSITN